MFAESPPAPARACASAPEIAAKRAAWPWLLGHALLFLGLYQVGYTPAEWAEIRPNILRQGNLGIAATHHTVGAFGLLRAYYRTGDDERLYHEYAELTLHGRADFDYLAQKHGLPAGAPKSTRPWPYRDVLVEYPPFALLLGMLPPALLGSSYVAYRFWLAAYLLVIHVLCLWVAADVAVEALRASDKRAVFVRFLRLSLPFCFCLGGLVATRMDSVVALSMLVAVACVERSLRARGRAALRWGCLAGLCAGVGVMTKIVPGLVLGAAAVAYWLSKRSDRLALGASLFASATAVVASVHVACTAAFGQGYLDAFRYHAARGLQIETSYAGLLMIAHAFGSPLQLALSHGSANLASPWADACASASPVLFVALACALLAAAVRAQSRELPTLLCALLCAFVLTNKVFSPQYLLWIAPFAWIAAERTRDLRVAPLLLFAAALSQVLYPRAYLALEHFHPALVLVLNLRNALMVALLALLWRALSQRAPEQFAAVQPRAGAVYDPAPLPMVAKAED